MDNETAERWVSIQQASGLLNKSERTVRRWVEVNKIAHRREGRRVYVNVADLVPPEPEPVPDVIDLVHEIDILRTELASLRRENETLTSDNDRLWQQVESQRIVIESLAQAREFKAIEEPKERRRWRWPWQGEED